MPTWNLHIVENSATDTAVIDIEGRIGGGFWDSDQDSKNTKEKMKKELKKIADIKAKNIVVNINSLGGDVNHGLAIHDLLAQSKAKVTTNVNGMTASVATIIAQAGNVRKISDNAFYLIHNATGVVEGNRKDIKEAMKLLKKVDEKLLDIYVKRSGKPESEIQDAMDKGEWLTADEAKDLGLVDEIYEPMQAAAVIDLNMLNEMRLPGISEEKLSRVSNITIENFTHNSTLDKSEPTWGSVDKTKLPQLAFADKGEADKKSTWGYPHHWIEGGTKTNANGIYTDGTMYLHKGGLDAAWAAAQGAHTGKKASQEVIDHLEAHRKAIGINNLTNNNQMKKILLAGLTALAAFFGKKVEDEIEFSQEDAQKVNNELQSRADQIGNLTTELTNLKTAKQTADTTITNLTNENATLKTDKTTLEAEVTRLKALPGAQPAAATSASEQGKKSPVVVSDDKPFMENMKAVTEKYGK